MPTEKEIRQWVRDEWAKIEREKQDACEHLRSCTFQPNGDITCDQCGKTLEDA